MIEEKTRELVRQERRLFFNRLAWYRRRVESLEEQTVLDDLTGLRNQRALWRELTRRGATASASSPLTVLMLDFDMMGEVNERYGHATGDAVLRRAAGILRDAAPSPRLAFRYGGEEFVLLLPGDAEDGRALAEQVRATIAAQNGELPAVTASCGVAQFDAPAEPWVALDRSDAALRAAKRAGRNRVVVSGDGDLEGNAYLVEELEQETARRAALALAVAALGERDRATAEHSDDVLTLCECIGRHLGLKGRDLDCLMAGAQLHDVGKVAVPSEILNKPGPLDDREWGVVRQHTVVGERILRAVPEMAEVATIVRHSHEYFDGSGYPDGLAGEQIPLASRVILCADAFHAIRSDRPYRPGRPAQESLAEIRAAAGDQLDPKVVDALVAVANDVRAERRRGMAGVAMPRRRRLIALLATLAIGSGSAVAGIPELRDAVKAIFGTTTPDVDGPISYRPGEGFTFGPLGDLLSIDPAAAKRAGAEKPSTTRRSAANDRANARGSGRRARRSGGFQEFGRTPSGAERGPSSLGVERTPAPTGGTAPGTGGTAPGGSFQPQSPAGNGNGRALGRILPTPRRPAQSPSGAQSRGRTDPPAIGYQSGPARVPATGLGR